MSNLVFLIGDFCSGSTLLFTLFRETHEYYCLYEPLHPLLPEYLIWPLRVYEHHFFVKDYFTEYRGFDRINDLFDRRWATHDLYLTADDEDDKLYRYLNYLIGMAFGRSDKVLIKCNRLTFRLEWLRAHFPKARMIHIHRKPESQWKSILHRSQEHVGREDVGQYRPDFEGFNIASWCEDLKGVFPELAAEHSKDGFERFLKLYDRALAANRAQADISLDYRDLCSDFETQCARMFAVAGCGADVSRLKSLIVPPETQTRPEIGRHGLAVTAGKFIDRLGRKYARARVRLADQRREGRLTPFGTKSQLVQVKAGE